MPPVFLSNKQSDWVKSFLSCFSARAMKVEIIPVPLRSHLILLRSMADEGIGFSQEDFNVLIWAIEVYFNVFEETDIDPLAEQTYAKLTGYAPFNEPWYDRILDVLPPNKKYKGVRQEKLGF